MRPASLAALVLGLLAAACDAGGLLYDGEPAPATAALSVSLSPTAGADAAGAAAGPGATGVRRDSAAVRPGDRARILVTRPQSVVLDTVLYFGSAAAGAGVFLPVTILGGREHLDLRVELRRAGDALLRGAATVLARRGRASAVTVPLGSTPIAPLAAVTGISAGVHHGCAVAGDGRAYCWGRNASGQLGDGTGADSRVPTAVAAETRLTSISAGYAHTCALAGDGRAFCWGSNAYGALGDGTTTDRARPVPVLGELRFRSIAAGGRHTCALDFEGRAYCWGRNDRGQLGDGTTADRGAPIPVGGDHRFTMLAAGGLHTCGVERARTGDAGAVYCWGYNQRGALGDGSTTDSPGPVQAADGAVFTRVDAGLHHTCGVIPDGRARCWGYNGHGQLGNGTALDSTEPLGVVAPATPEFAAGVRARELDGRVRAVLPDPVRDHAG